MDDLSVVSRIMENFYLLVSLELDCHVANVSNAYGLWQNFIGSR